jgi:hypothetical protein
MKDSKRHISNERSPLESKNGRSQTKHPKRKLPSDQYETTSPSEQTEEKIKRKRNNNEIARLPKRKIPSELSQRLHPTRNISKRKISDSTYQTKEFKRTILNEQFQTKDPSLATSGQLGAPWGFVTPIV